MLSLDDPRWNSLRHAYGSAGDIPELLLKLKGSRAPKIGAEDEPWFTLWSSLCHQGDVYTASYAAVPHLVDMAFQSTGPIDSSFFHLPAAIEVARVAGRGPEIPPPHLDAYQAAIGRLVECVSIHRNEAWDQSMLLSAAAALAVAKGHTEVAEALLNLDDDWLVKINNCDFD